MVVPELCVNDVLKRVAEGEMSSANPVRGDPLPDWLQPFDENLVDEEEQRDARVEVCGDPQHDDQERERELLHKEKELDRYLNPGFPVGRRFRNTN